MLGRFIDDVERRRKQLLVYTDREETDLAERLATRNVTVEHRELPAGGPEPFVAVRDGERFAGAMGLDRVEELLAPPVAADEPRTVSEGYRALTEILEETLFSSLDRRQLLATSREIEDRARRVGRGTLHVGFQSLSVFRTQTETYRKIAAETDLDVHVYGTPDWEPPAIENVTYHPDVDGSLAPFWCLAFDGGGESVQACALVAREREDGYTGFWTYDPEFVGDICSALAAATE